MFPQIFPTVMGKSELLTWSHYDILFTVSDDKARNWYAHEAYNENKQIFQAKYLTFLPTENELKREIERQKTLFLLQQEK